MGRKTKKGRSVKRNLAVNSDEPDELKRAPHSFVIHRGRVGNYILELVKDFRKVMEPFTASSLQARKKNLIKDYVSIAGILHVSHLCIFTHTEVSTYLKIVRLPRGPTLTFKVHNYSLAHDVVSTIKKQLVFTKQFEHSPLIVLNGFSGEGIHMKLMTSMFQNMFPTINLLKVNLNNIRRCVLFSYNPTSKLIDFRHYAIKVVPAGISKGVKKIVQSKVPNLGRYESVSDYLTNPAQLSDSEAEDDPASHVTLPQKLSSRGNAAASTSAIRLVEMGPRLTLELLKVEEGLLGGEVLHHELVEKTEEEKKLIKLKREQKRKLKEKRKKIQEDNKKQKELKKEMHKQKSLKGMQKRSENEVQMLKAVEEANQNADEDDNDVEWYKEEVGQNPDSDLFSTTTAFKKKRFIPYKVKRRKGPKSDQPKKKVRFG
ncbi:protein Peter pan [Anabrus simplex]|uniref:protein Peter pan n=1 Tax=Anabrus simplex TaxID=316456 RepID=UPI0035A31C67